MVGSGGEPTEVPEELLPPVNKNGNGGSYYQCVRYVFKAVVQVVLLFGAETWVITPSWANPWGFLT